MRKLALVVLAACGGGGNPIAEIDAGGTAADAAPSCGTTWELVEVPATALELLDPVPAVDGRSVRVGVTVEGDACDERAMMTVGYTLEGEGVAITPRVWRPVGCMSEALVVVTRPVVLGGLYAGTWTITSAGVANLTIDVGAAPGACNLARTPCQLDCDCDEGSGERCLGYGGFGGPTTACARPCEVDRDCGGTTCEGDIADGLGHVCTTSPECGVDADCPDGWTCGNSGCLPTFTLDQGSRHECACDGECEAGLRCVNPFDPTAPRRCEAICETAGPWCQGAHVCGSVGSDLSGLAGVDAVCGWLGE